jgi:hypothetical protein
MDLALLPTPVWNRMQRCRSLTPPSEAEIAAIRIS